MRSAVALVTGAFKRFGADSKTLLFSDGGHEFPISGNQRNSPPESERDKNAVIHRMIQVERYL